MNITEGYLTKEELISAHGQCGSVLHARNPFGKQIDHAHYRKKMNEWPSKIITLLNSHLINLLDDKVMYLIQLNAIDQPIKTYVFERSDA